jgi:hypothetical protein
LPLPQDAARPPIARRALQPITIAWHRSVMVSNGLAGHSWWEQKRRGLPALTWRARCWVVVPVAIFYGYSPHNSWSFSANFATAYGMWLVLSFLWIRHRPRPETPLLAHARLLPARPRARR